MTMRKTNLAYRLVPVQQNLAVTQLIFFLSLKQKLGFHCCFSFVFVKKKDINTGNRQFKTMHRRQFI